MGFVADVFDVTMIDPKTKDVFGSTTLQDANIELGLESTDIRGGKGNALLGVLHSDRDITVNLTEVSFKYDWLAKQMGTNVVTGASVAYAMPKFFEVTADTITLDETPTEDFEVAVYTETGEKISGHTVLDNEVDFSVATPTVEAGDLVEVRAYQYATDEGTETIEFDISKFPKGVILVLETVEIEGDETISHRLQYQFDNAVPDGNMTINTASAREAQTSEMVLRIVKPKTSTKVGRSLRFPYVEGESTP